jgi:elongation factor Ts
MDQKELVEKVKKLREELGLGIMEIKAALEEAQGAEEKAKEILKQKGFEKAEKKAERETHQGRVFTYTHSTGKIGAMVEIWCETDFVAKTEDFMNLGKELTLQVAAMDPKDTEELLAQDYMKDGSVKVGDLVKNVIAKLGENVKVGKIARFEI